jgi:hypothetical protein
MMFPASSPFERHVLRATILAVALSLGSVPTALAQARGMTFRPMALPDCGGPCPGLLMAQGPITDDTFRQFRAIASRLAPHRPIVVLNSPGGTIPGGILLGLAFREHGAAVVVPRGGACDSACAYAFLGGVNRRVLDGGRLGLHRFFALSVASGRRSRGAVAYERAVGPKVVALLRDYVVRMGVSPAVVTVANETGSSSMRRLSPDELRRYGIVTGR